MFKSVPSILLVAIIAVGSRVKSQRGTQLWPWATSVLHDHIGTGYWATDQRLRQLSFAWFRS
jgi:hypothetical protein